MPSHFSSHMANERTLLAWLRTAVALMGFGFLIAKFGYLLPSHAVTGQGFEGIGAAVTLGGGFVAMTSTIRFLSRHRDILADRDAPSYVLPLAVAVGIVLLDAYLVWMLFMGGAASS